MNRSGPLSRDRSGGFTLVEVLVSCVILAALGIVLSGVFKGLVRASVSSSDLTSSIISAKNVMEDLRGRSFAELPSFNGSSFDNGKGRVEVSPAGGDLLLISVKDSIELVTLRSRYD